jgi:luciferase family oxidoreductase group 1
VLDLVPLACGGESRAALRSAEELARAVDRLGYARLWYAEHHDMPAIGATTPDLLIAHMAPLTSRIRLGAGGVMLPNHSPLKVAESYRLLEALHPNRIDLGLGRPPGTDPVANVALRRSRREPTQDDFLAQLGELMAYGDGDFPPDHPFRNVRAVPEDVALPPFWLLGSSDYSARLAAKLGLGFAFAGHFNPEPPDHALGLYRDEFTPADTLERPYAILALSVFCAETEEAARCLASSVLLSFVELRSGRARCLPSPEEALAHVFTREEAAIAEPYRRLSIAGTPEQVYGRIEAVAARSGADEVMVATHAHDPAARLRSFELLARAFRLTGAR